MLKNIDEEKTKWDQVMENFDLLYARINDMGITQQELKTQIQLNNTKVEQCSKDQKFIAQQVQANGQAVAQLTLRQFEEENRSVSTSSESLIEEEEQEFQNVFAKHKLTSRPKHSRAPRHKDDNAKHESVPHALPKCTFLSLIALSLRSRLIIVQIISPSILYQLQFGYLLQPCTLRGMHQSGGRHISNNTLKSLGYPSVWQLSRNLGMMTIE